jgi:hypothetical protein
LVFIVVAFCDGPFVAKSEEHVRSSGFVPSSR